MDLLDIETFRSKYSDITVTAVPSSKLKEPKQTLPQPVATRSSVTSEATTQPPRVEITRLPMADGNDNAAGSTYRVGAMQRRSRHQQPQQQRTGMEANAYALEYKQVMAKLEYTKYMQAQLQLLSVSNNTHNAPGVLNLDSAALGAAAFPLTSSLDPGANIVDKYDDLLRIIGQMPVNVPPSIIGARASKERLMRDIAHARLLVRECQLLLQRSDEEP